VDAIRSLAWCTSRSCLSPLRSRMSCTARGADPQRLNRLEHRAAAGVQDVIDRYGLQVADPLAAPPLTGVRQRVEILQGAVSGRRDLDPGRADRRKPTPAVEHSGIAGARSGKTILSLLISCTVSGSATTPLLV